MGFTARRFTPRDHAPEDDHKKRGLCIAAPLIPGSLKESGSGRACFDRQPEGRKAGVRSVGDGFGSHHRAACQLHRSSPVRRDDPDNSPCIEIG